MTTQELARLLHARRIGRGKWMALCPAHPDRHPSLSITEGRKAVLIKCQSHDCTPRAVCEALGIRVGDLFYERRQKLSVAGLQRLETQRAKEAHKEKAEKVKIRNLIAQARYWRSEVEKRAKLLIAHPEDGKLGRQFHWALDRQRTAQAAIRPYFHPAFVKDADL